MRVALLNIPENRKSAACPPSEEDAQTAPRPLREGLESLFAPYAGELDGLLFSDIQSHKGQVVVYGAGPAFRELALGAEHAYEGTIAQDIERFGLRSLTVEDTLDSIKSIDWVLFAPHGHPLLFRQTVLYGAGPARHPHPRQPPPRFLRRGRRNPLRQPHGAF